MDHRMKTSVYLAVLALGLGCNPWENLPIDGSTDLGSPLWDDGVVAATDGIYVTLPRAGSLVRVTPDGAWAEVDLGGAAPTALHLAEDGETLLAFLRWPTCESEDEDVETVSDCPDDELAYAHSLALVRDGGVVGAEHPLAAHFNRVAFSPGSPEQGIDPVAVVYVDLSGGIDLEGIVNLSEVVFVDLEGGAPTPVPVGFQANQVLFTPDGDRAVVFSQNEAAVVELVSGAFEVTVRFPFVLDPDDQVVPSGAAITPDGRYLLMTAQGSGDLYALDLENESINIVDLDGAPSALAVDDTADRSAIVYGGRAQVDLLEHERFDVETVELDEACNRILETDAGFSLLYNTSANTHDIYRLDLETGDLVEYRVPNPVLSMEIAEDLTRAVALLRTESSYGGDAFDPYWGMSVLDLSTERTVDFMLESKPVGLALTQVGEAAWALLLLEGYDALIMVDLVTSERVELELPAFPTGIGSVPGGGFYITYDVALGLVSYLDPETMALTDASEFAASGLFLDDTLPRTGGEEE